MPLQHNLPRGPSRVSDPLQKKLYCGLANFICGLIDNVYALSIVIGTLVTAEALFVLKRPVAVEGETEDEATVA